MLAAASMMAAAPEPMKHSLLSSQAHSLIAFAFRVLWVDTKLHLRARSLQPGDRRQSLPTCALGWTLQPLQVALGRTAVCAGATAPQEAEGCSLRGCATTAACPHCQSPEMSRTPGCGSGTAMGLPTSLLKVRADGTKKRRATATRELRLAICWSCLCLTPLLTPRQGVLQTQNSVSVRILAACPICSADGA